MSTTFDLPVLVRSGAALGLSGAALLMAGNVSAQSLPPLSPAEINSLPPEYRTGPVPFDRTETTIGPDGVETITRTRFIPAPVPNAAVPAVPYPGAFPGSMQQMPMAYTQQPAVFERQQWIEECRRRTAGRNRDDTGTIIGALLGAIGGGIAGNQIAAAGDRFLGTVVGGAAGGLGGGLIGSLFNRRKREAYDCEAALDSYLSQPVPAPRVASRIIPMAPMQAYPAMQQPTYYYAPPSQETVISVRYEQPQQVVVRETIREEVVPGAARIIPAPPPTKLIKVR